ncbi:MAG: hypothetical protein AABW87_00855 [Nanoarchaeota archaeon]
MEAYGLTGTVFLWSASGTGYVKREKGSVFYESHKKKTFLLYDLATKRREELVCKVFVVEKKIERDLVDLAICPDVEVARLERMGVLKRIEHNFPNVDKLVDIAQGRKK